MILESILIVVVGLPPTNISILANFILETFSVEGGVELRSLI